MPRRLALVALLLSLAACDSAPEEPAAPALSECTVSASAIEPGEEVTFGATINSDALEPTLISIDWGDGEPEAVTSFPVVHTYEASGSFTPTVTAINPLGSSTCRQSVEVSDPFCADVSAVSVFFPLGVSSLDDKELPPLQETAFALRRCTDLCLAIEAYTDDVEADPTALSQARAEAVQSVFVSAGVARARTTAQGLGVDPNSNSGGSAEPGDSRARRADATPGICPQ